MIAHVRMIGRSLSMDREAPCNCDQACELTEVLEKLCFLCESTESESTYPLRGQAQEARAVLDKWHKVAVDYTRCQHCGQIGGH